MDSTLTANLTPSLSLDTKTTNQPSVVGGESNDDIIRNRLFQRLGIVSLPQKSMAAMPIMKSRDISNSHFNLPILEPIKCPCHKQRSAESNSCTPTFNKCPCRENDENKRNTPTADGDGEEDRQNHLNFSPSTADDRRKGVRFTDTAQVWLIPRRQDYSHRLRKQLWYERHEQLSNVRRNTIEFWYEGWNWETVMEEQSMYTNVASGERIHPAHVQEYYWKVQQQQQLLQQQQQQLSRRHAPARVHYVPTPPTPAMDSY